jgi:hypothetical protein
MKLVRVTDHAVLRYLERVQGFDVEKVREHIAKLCSEAAAAGAKCVHAEGYKFEIGASAVVSVVPKERFPNRTRRERR